MTNTEQDPGQSQQEQDQPMAMEQTAPMDAADSVADDQSQTTTEDAAQQALQLAPAVQVKARALNDPPQFIETQLKYGMCAFCQQNIDPRLFWPRPPLQCAQCHSIFHMDCIPAVRNLGFPVLLGDDFFEYKCSRCCEDGNEQLRRLTMSWPDVLHVIIFHLTHSGYPTDHVDPVTATRFFQIKQHIAPGLEEHWPHFWLRSKTDNWSNSVASSLSLASPVRFLSGKSFHGSSGWWALTDPFLYPSLYEVKRSRTAQYMIAKGELQKIVVEKAAKRPKVSPSDDEEDTQKGSKKAKVKNPAKNTSSTTNATSSASVTTTKDKKPANANPRTKKSKKNDAKSNNEVERKVTMLYLDVPNKKDDAVRISRELTHSAPQFRIEPDQLTVYNDKGYRMCKASHGVTHGTWYFECTVLEPKTPNGNLRIGWSQISGDLQAPVGYDQFSYGYRATPASLFHMADKKKYGSVYRVGDVLGVMITLPKVDSNIFEQQGCDPLPAAWDFESRYDQVPYRGERPILPQSEIRFFVNGVDQGTAAKNIYYGKYYPAISSYMGGCVQVEFENFKYPPDATAFPDFKPMSQAREEQL